MGKTSYHFHVRWGDTDAAAIVFYPNFYKWMDEATHHFFSTIGYPTPKLFTEDKVGVPILEAKCQFKSPLVFDDKVTVQSEITDLQDKVFKIEHVFIKEGTAIATGYELRAWVSFTGDKPKAFSIPAEVREAIQKTLTSGN